jgi:flagellar hook-associated protein FlgK
MSMLNSFSGLEMGKRALSAFRRGIDVAGHNMSNVDTPGYSRQRVNLATTDPYWTVPGQIGTGVKVSDIVRIRDQFLDFQYRSQLSSLGYWSQLNTFYNMVQLYIAEPQGDGIRAGFDQFRAALQDLQENPESSASRRAVVEQAKSLGGMLDTLVQGYDEYASALNSQVKSAVDQANSMLHQVASLNQEIARAQALDQNPNDLMDKRDLLLDALSEMLDVDIQEPFTNGDITGEYFITLNGRTLVQGDKVRELVAHAFQWEGKTYYDVQVRDNEFDIVENTGVALALATGPEGVHQLNVYRLANGEEWTIGGEDPLCLNPNGSLKTILTSKIFPLALMGSERVVLPTWVTGDPASHTFTVTSGDYSAEFTLTWDSGSNAWEMKATVDNSVDLPQTTTVNSTESDLTLETLADFMNDVFNDLPVGGEHLSVTVNADGTFTLTSNVDSVSVTNDTVPLGMTTSYVRMRVRPMTTTEPLGLATSFRIQVGTQGTRVASKIFDNLGNPDLSAGDILGEGQLGDSYTFRVGANDYQADITVTRGAGGWVLTSDTGKTYATTPNHLTAADMADFLKQVLPSSGDDAFTVNAGPAGSPTQFSIESNNNYLISINDVIGDLAGRMGMVNPNPVITIDVDETDSLETIRNRINEKYQEAYGLTAPEQWVHASLMQDSDQSWYLSIASDVAGEAQRIVIMGDEDGNMQTLRRLGLVKEQQTGTPGVYREVTGYSKVAEDAYFTFDGIKYLSDDNKFEKARRVPSGTNRNDYSASVLEGVSEGLWLELRGTGRTAITVRHHVQGGSIKAMEEIRDGLIPQLKGELNELAWSLVKSFNAYQYSGYGIEGGLNTTGVAFFDSLRFKSSAAGNFAVSKVVDNDVNLIGAAMGMLDADGKATYGQSSGSGSGSNASRMAAFQEASALAGSIGGSYEAYLAKIGSEAGRASLMYEAKKNLTDQIDEQRQSVMGVNIDDEMLDVLMFNQAFNAMARYVTTIDEMLDRIINGFGLVGR